MTLLQERAGGNELPEEEAGAPVVVATQQLRNDVVSRFADFFDLLGNRQRQLVLGSDQMKQPLAREQRNDVLGSINLLGQCTRSGKGLAYIGGRIAFSGGQCRSECDLQVKLLLLVPRAVRQAGKQGQALPQLHCCFDQRRARQRMPPGLEPVADRLLRQPGLRAVLGKRRGLGRRNLGKLLFKRRGDAGMQLLAPAAQQRTVGGVLHQRVLEGIFRIGGCPAPEDQFGVHELRQGVIQLPLRHRRHGADELV
jgi:hypothetical protein